MRLAHTPPRICNLGPQKDAAFHLLSASHHSPECLVLFDKERICIATHTVRVPNTGPAERLGADAALGICNALPITCCLLCPLANKTCSLREPALARVPRLPRSTQSRRWRTMGHCDGIPARRACMCTQRLVHSPPRPCHLVSLIRRPSPAGGFTDLHPYLPSFPSSCST